MVKKEQMMTKKKIFLLISLFVILLFSIRTAWYSLLAKPNFSGAVHGVLDLRNFDFAADNILTLNGQWEFYPYQFLYPDNQLGKDRHNNRTFIQVPQNWAATLNPETNSKLGYGTYRLRILVNPDPHRVYSIKLSYIVSASAVYVNGRLVGGSGKPGESPEQNFARNVPYTVSFTSDKSELDLVVQVANYDHDRRGGITTSLKMGTAEAIEQDRWFSICMQVIVCAVLVLHAIYVCILFIIGIREKSLISFLLLILFTLMMTLIDDDRLLLDWLPIDYAWSIKLSYIAIIGAAAFLMLFAKSLLATSGKALVFRSFFWICSISVLLIALTPAYVTTDLAGFYFGLSLIASIILLCLSIKTALTKDEDAIFIALGISSILTNVLGGYLKAYKWPDIGYYPVDLIVAFLMFASYWFKRYFRTSLRTSELAVQLQAADKMKDIFLANTSHELRNPLHGMINIAQSLLENWDNPRGEKGKETLQMIIKVGKRMSFLLNDLLDITRLQENRISLHVRPIRIQALAAGVIDMVQFMLEGKPIRLINAIPDDFPAVVADENRLMQIMFNLLHNAVKYTQEGSITLQATMDGELATISVIDTGIGMDEQTKQRIFLPYEQGNEATTAMNGGMGLGLSITKQLVELHGGTIVVSAVPGQGSHFRFTLPLAAEDVPLPEDRPIIQPGTMGQQETAAAAPLVANEGTDSEDADVSADRPNILAVDDDPVNLNVLKSILPSDNYEIITATSGEEALSLLELREWDLVIADVMMPNISGYQLSRLIRKRFPLSELPILLLTARGQPEDIHTGFLAGANDYVTKPVDAQVLRSRVQALTDMKQSVRERLRMEAAWLQAQIKPHFLFNTLNTVAAFHLKDPDRMSELLEAFGNYLRASFDFRNSQRLVSLEHELDLLRSYLYLEQERFGDRLNIQWEIDEKLNVQIPPLSIQPLVENAIRHGVLKRVRGGTVWLRITAVKDHVQITVTDDGVGMDEHTLRTLFDGNHPKRSGIGLLNTDRRLKQMYGKGLQMESRPGLGTTVSFSVPKQLASEI
ncbi:ATP-binding protein [Brevibacillus fulvus]|uniref:histidine kinase n=1 Tax=Brevibacillus fulvus TaxID=1125967 RepID=A0A938XVT6_9BACL|nr:ATP-binding protein [Brevibacillus fulvus]MBM7591398.1 sensor histidine kinase YesM [Brevibacillus fulvus]